MTITQFLNTQGFHSFEGYSQEVPKQVEDLIRLSNGSNINIMEIGFNAGHSADIFLQNNSSLTLTSFDLGDHIYVLTGKEYIDKTYPNRHTLILGDSTVTVPKYINDNPNKVFDLIFIDGGHDYSVAKADLENCMKLANNNTVIIMDDTIYRFNNGPAQTWIEHINRGLIREINRVDYGKDRGMSWGKYVLG